MLHGDELLQLFQAVHILDLVDEFDAARRRRRCGYPEPEGGMADRVARITQLEDALSTTLKSPSPPSARLHPLPLVGWTEQDLGAPWQEERGPALILTQRRPLCKGSKEARGSNRLSILFIHLSIAPLRSFSQGCFPGALAPAGGNASRHRGTERHPWGCRTPSILSG